MTVMFLGTIFASGDSVPVFRPEGGLIMLGTVLLCMLIGVLYGRNEINREKP
jgi:hypothetical protein